MFSHTSSNAPSSITKEEQKKAIIKKMLIIIDRYKDRVSTFPKHKVWFNRHLYKYKGFWFYQGFWLPSNASFSIEAVMALQDDFHAQPNDIFLASYPKSGTTWLKALAFAIVNRSKYQNNMTSCSTHPLSNTSPHVCVSFIEAQSFIENISYTSGLFATHIPYSLLPESIITCGCRIVYICRNPKDVLISFWHFVNKLRDDSCPPITLEEAFEFFSKGITLTGSYWDHFLGYHKASLEHPRKVLFLNYEEMKKDVRNSVTKLAKFLGFPFTKEEETGGAMQEIVNLCSFENLSKANKDGKMENNKPNNVFFREGKVGDSVKYLTIEMIQTLDRITKEKFHGLDIPL